MHAIEIASTKKKGWISLWLETYSQLVTLTLKNHCMVPWRLRNRWLNCVELTKNIRFIISHIFRECILHIICFPWSLELVLFGGTSLVFQIYLTEIGQGSLIIFYANVYQGFKFLFAPYFFPFTYVFSHWFPFIFHNWIGIRPPYLFASYSCMVTR